MPRGNNAVGKAGDMRGLTVDRSTLTTRTSSMWAGGGDCNPGEDWDTYKYDIFVVYGGEPTAERAARMRSKGRIILK